MATPPPVPEAPESDWQKHAPWFAVPTLIFIASFLEGRGFDGVQSLIGSAICGALFSLYKQNERLHEKLYSLWQPSEE